MNPYVCPVCNENITIWHVGKYKETRIMQCDCGRSMFLGNCHNEDRYYVELHKKAMLKKEKQMEVNNER